MVFGIHSLAHYALSVPDLEKGQAFSEAMGLSVRRDGGILALSGTDGRCGGYLVAGPKKRLHHLGFRAYPEDMTRIEAAARRLAGGFAAAPEGFSGNGLWFTDLDGNLINVTAGERTAPLHKRPGAVPIIGEGQRGAPAHGDGRIARPARFSHIALFTPDIETATAFYREVLGLRVADQTKGAIAFMYGPQGSDHHILAFVASPAAGVHHLTWEYPTLDDLGLATMQVRAIGYNQGWGMGRHVIGSNFFYYARDPWRGLTEFTCDMDYIPAGADWQAGDYPAEDAFFIWGPDLPEDFVTNYEASA